MIITMTDTNHTVTAKVSNYRGTPRKLRLLADFVRGKNAKKAVAELSFVNKRHADAVSKLIQSALANAKENKDMSTDNLVVSDIQIQEGKSMKRHRAGSRGRAVVFRRRLSHMSVTLSPKQDKQED